MSAKKIVQACYTDPLTVFAPECSVQATCSTTSTPWHPWILYTEVYKPLLHEGGGRCEQHFGWHCFGLSVRSLHLPFSIDVESVYGEGIAFKNMFNVHVLANFSFMTIMHLCQPARYWLLTMSEAAGSCGKRLNRLKWQADILGMHRSLLCYGSLSHIKFFSRMKHNDKKRRFESYTTSSTHFSFLAIFCAYFMVCFGTCNQTHWDSIARFHCCCGNNLQGHLYNASDSIPFILIFWPFCSWMAAKKATTCVAPLIKGPWN